MKRLIAITVMLMMQLASISQTTVKMNELNMPTSPAFVIMDKSPATIEKPANPRAFAASLINLWEGNGAIEFAPYWFKDRPAYTFEENLRKTSPVFQTLGISAGTSKQDTVTRIGVGIRTQVLRIYAPKLQSAILAIKNEIVELLSVEDPSKLDLDAINKAKKKLMLLQGKTSINIEIAGAYRGEAADHKGLFSDRAGGWLHFRWTPYQFPLDFTALARYSWAANTTNEFAKDSSFLDYGLNVSYQDKEKSFELQVEYVKRHDLLFGHNYDHFAFVSNYQIIPGIVAVASIGKDFKKVNNVFALIGVKFGISKEVMRLQ